tara:strand:+ start:10196 stop:10630 length:435 start_codon:yes stop_codon:yes gene_type:complete
MAIIRERAVRNKAGRQVGGANRPRIATAYDKDPLRMVMEPALTAFGQQAGGQFGAQLGGGLGKGAISGLSSLGMDQSASPSQRMAQSNAMLESLRQRYGLGSQAELRDPDFQSKLSEEDREMFRMAENNRSNALLEAYSGYNQL